jgi:hypothetical protein
MTSIQLTDTQGFDPSSIVFSKPDTGNIDKIKFKRVRIGTRYPDGGIGDLIIATPPNLHCFGLQESRDMGSNAINGYSMPLCLWGRNGPTDEEKRFTDVFNAIAERCKTHLLEHKDEIEKYDLDASDLKKFNPLFWKMEKGKVVEGRGPMLYAKVIHNKKTNKINTIFVNEETNQEIDPYEMLNKVCSVTAAVKIESIFIGNKVSLQVKLFEVVYKVRDTTVRGLLRPNALKSDTKALTGSYTPEPDVEDDDFDEEGSIVMETESLPVSGVPVALVEEEEEEEEAPPEPVATPVKTVEVEATDGKAKKGRATKAKK